MENYKEKLINVLNHDDRVIFPIISNTNKDIVISELLKRTTNKIKIYTDNLTELKNIFLK